MIYIFYFWHHLIRINRYYNLTWNNILHKVTNHITTKMTSDTAVFDIHYIALNTDMRASKKLENLKKMKLVDQ